MRRVRSTNEKGGEQSQLKKTEILLGDLPLTVLTAGKPSYTLGQSFIDGWLELHAELTALSSLGRRVVVEDNAHYIHIERPDVVDQEVLRMVEMARAHDAASEVDDSFSKTE